MNLKSTISSTQNRLMSIDILRGIIIILMALDHTRDFFGAASFAPTDLSQTNTAWFLTRWVTHFCAPLFILLTGMSAFLYLQKCQSKKQLSHFLITRGLWMIFVEIIFINLSWQFGYNFTFVQVIWVIGWSMLMLSAMIYLNERWILLLSVSMLLFHNTLNDSAILISFGDYAWVWRLIHYPSGFQLFNAGWYVHASYSIFPWPGVMGLGYVLGRWFIQSPLQRRKLLILAGAFSCVGFVSLRYIGVYGDPSVWSEMDTFGHQILAFLHTAKYPPSLQFLLMTIGPGLLILAWLDNVNKESKSYQALRYAKVFGSVPMFFYLLHVPVINFASQIYAYFAYGTMVQFFYGSRVFPENYEPSLMLTYLAWIFMLVLLYWPCKHYEKLKKRSTNSLLAYL